MRFRLMFLSIAMSGIVFCGCGENNSNAGMAQDSTGAMSADTGGVAKSMKPKGPAPTWGPDIKDEMAVVIEQLASYNAPPIETLTPAEARKQPTPAKAVMDVMQNKGISMPASMVDTAGEEIESKGGTIHARIYTPQGATSALPVVVYFHGGGWVIADLDTYDASARFISEKAKAVVVSVHYRQGPEHKFPAAHNDAFAAYQWTVKNASSIKGDPKNIAVVGESAGGNLAANVSIMARDKKIQLPVAQILVYPVANNDTASESYVKYAMAKPLNKAMMGWFVKNALPAPATAADPRISLVKANLKGLPPTTIIAAEIDPLLTEGKLLSDALDKAGVKVDYKRYDGVTHEFFGMGTVVPEAKDAEDYAVAQLKKSFK